MGYRVPLVLSSIPLLPWDTHSHSVWMVLCPRRSRGAWLACKLAWMYVRAWRERGRHAAAGFRPSSLVCRKQQQSQCDPSRQLSIRFLLRSFVFTYIFGEGCRSSRECRHVQFNPHSLMSQSMIVCLHLGSFLREKKCRVGFRREMATKKRSKT